MTMNHLALIVYLDKVRARTLKFLDELPEELLEQTPATGQSIAETFRHIAFGGDYWCHNVFKDGKGEVQYTAENCRGGKALRQALRESGRRLEVFFSADEGAALQREYLTSWGKSYNGTDRLLYLVAHEVHHRGRAVQVARELGWTGKVVFPM